MKIFRSIDLGECVFVIGTILFVSVILLFEQSTFIDEDGKTSVHIVTSSLKITLLETSLFKCLWIPYIQNVIY